MSFCEVLMVNYASIPVEGFSHSVWRYGRPQTVKESPLSVKVWETTDSEGKPSSSTKIIQPHKLDLKFQLIFSTQCGGMGDHKQSVYSLTFVLYEHAVPAMYDSL